MLYSLRKMLYRLTNQALDYNYKWMKKDRIHYGHEAYLNEIILQHSFGSFIDIGANSGYWSIRASEYYNSVFAIEPFEPTFKTLLQNIRLNKIQNIIPINVALSDTKRVQTFYLHPSTAHNSFRRKSGNSITINTTTLDQISPILIPGPFTMKIDTEGEEYPILLGTSNFIREHHPRLIVEQHLEDDEKRIVDLLRSLGYNHIRQYPIAMQTYIIAS